MVSYPELVEHYLAGPAALRAAVAGMSPEQLRAKPIPGRWSTLEVVAHLADFEPVLADRMKRVIAMERPLLLGADENLFAMALGYADRDVEEELTLIAVTRGQMGRILKAVPPEVAANRCGVHSERGLLTLEGVLNLAVKHIPHHLAFVEHKRKALGLGEGK